METWATPYLIPYLSLFLLWMLGANRQILFWLYLWQLKEYHVGRFLAHFETAKGKSLFSNPLFAAKIVALAFSVVYFYFYNKILLSIAIIFTIFLIQAVYSLFGILKMNLLRPVITKKSLLLIVACHIFIFSAGVLVHNTFLGEMSLPDFVMSALFLLVIDILLPAAVALIVLSLQPFTIREKNKILNRAAAVIAGRSDLVTIGIAGSYGKSVTKELLALLLSKKFKVLKTKANQNTEIGVSTAVINELKAEHQIFVCEIGAVHKGRIAQVAGIVKPKIGILTGINQQHLGVFGSQKNVVDAKFEILDALPQAGTAVLNWNSAMVRDNFEGRKPAIKAENIILAGKDMLASEITATVGGLSFVVNYKGEKISLNTNAKGGFMSEPILLAVAGALAAGMDLNEIGAAINKLDFKPFNIGSEQNSLGMNVLSSTYSANPDGVLSHLDYLKLLPGKKAVIMPCLIELGKTSKNVHFEIGKKIATVCDIAIITTADRFDQIKKGALDGGMKAQDIVLSEKPVPIVELLKKRLGAGDAILLEGRMSQSIIDCVKK